jgi:hypothetical protein
MNDEAKAKHTKTAIEKLARVTSIILKASGVGIGILLPLMFLLGYLAGDFAFIICGLFLLSVGLVGVLAGITRLLLSVFGETQMRLNEMLATVLVAGAASVLLVNALNASSGDIEMKIICAVLCFLTFVITGACSAWGWSVFKRLGVHETWPRLKLLFYGWLMLAGFGCMGVFLLHLFGAEREPATTGSCIALAIWGLGSLLIIPAMRTELACRRKAKAEGNQQTLKPPPSTQAPQRE